jgi:hypothetical protein
MNLLDRAKNFLSLVPSQTPSARPQPSSTTVGGRADSQQTIKGLLWHPSRMPINPVVYTMDRELISQRRQLAWNTVRDIDQNLTLLGWLVRMDLMYTSQFAFSPRTGDVVYDRELREWWELQTDPEVIDVQRRLSFEELMGLWACLRIYDGYSLVLKSKKGRLQLFEAWNIARGSGCEEDEKRYDVKINKNGVVLDENNAIDWVAVATGETSGTLKHRYLAFHDECILDGETMRAADTLWESPILAALDKCRDYSSADDYNLMKAKLHAMFVVARYIDNETKGGADFPARSGIGGFPYAEEAEPADQSNMPVPQPPPLSEIRSGMMITGEKGEKYEFLESKTPSNEFVVFCKKVCRDILLVRDIPYSFLDSESANYSSMKADSTQYNNSCYPKRKKNARGWRKAIKHRMRWGISSGDMPMWSGKFTVDTLPFALVPRATSILDPSKELPSVVTKLNARLMDFEQAHDEMTGGGGGSWFDVIDRTADQLAYAEKKGVPINLGTVTIKLTGQSDTEEEPEKVPVKTAQ